MTKVNAKNSHLFDLPARLKLAMQAANHKQKDVKDATGVDQSQISRILNGKYSRMGRAAKSLWEYADMQICGEAPELQIEIRERLQKAAEELWNGSIEDGKRILYLLESIKRLTVRTKNDGSTE